MRLILLILLAILAWLPLDANATDLRGRVDGYNPYTQMGGPLPGIGVALFVVYPNGTYQAVRQALTGMDGMYYLSGVYPGQYILQIGGVNYPLAVGLGPKQDLPIITR